MLRLVAGESPNRAVITASTMSVPPCSLLNVNSKGLYVARERRNSLAMPCAWPYGPSVVTKLYNSIASVELST
jgi:hypothetical protein